MATTREADDGFIQRGSQGMVHRYSADLVTKQFFRATHFAHEIEILGRVSDMDGVARLFGVDASEWKAWLEFGGSALIDVIREKPELPWKPLHAQIIRATSHLHARGIMHGDLKLDNILYHDQTEVVKLCDFGHARVIAEHERDADCLTRPRGSMSYACPEMLDGRNYNGFAADSWSVGVVLYALAVHCFPFESAATDCADYVRFAHKVEREDCEPTEALLSMYPLPAGDAPSDSNASAVERLHKCADREFMAELDKFLHPMPQQRFRL